MKTYWAVCLVINVAAVLLHVVLMLQGDRSVMRLVLFLVSSACVCGCLVKLRKEQGKRAIQDRLDQVIRGGR